MQSYHGKGAIGSTILGRVAEQIGVAVEELAGSIKDGLLAVCVTVGLEVMRQMMEEEVNELVGVKGKHNKERKAVRHGVENGSVVLGGRKVRIKRPRVRTRDGREVRLETYQAFRDARLLTQAALERMLHGLSTRQYRHGLEPMREDLEELGTSRSTISRRFREATRKALSELMSRPLGDLKLVVLFIDGIEVAGHTVVVAMGLDTGGRKYVLGLWEGATENAAVCRALLSDLVERGLRVEDGLLVVIDGSKALRAAVRDVLGSRVLVQRCQVHKKRNVLEHLPEEARGWVGRKLDRAYNESDYDRALAGLKALAGALEKEYPGAAASLREGLEETLTVLRLGVPELLQRSLRTTNVIESAFDGVRVAARNVKRWQSGEQVLRWTAAGLLEAESRFHRIAGYRDLPLSHPSAQEGAIARSIQGGENGLKKERGSATKIYDVQDNPACSAPGSLQDLFTKFWVNFVCRHKRNSSKQWEKIDTCYEFARRLAYLNLDSVYCDLPLASPAASMIRRMVRGNTGGHELGELKNVLAAYERAAFNALYHSPPARRAVAFVADRVHLKLRRLEVAEASNLILHWLKVNPPDLCDPDIVVGDEEPRFSVAAKHRSFFIPNPPSIVGWEQELARKVRPAAAVSILLFPAWDIGMVHLEPDEVLVDVFGSITPGTRLIGRLISWLADRLDRPNASPKDPYWMAVRGDLVEVYRDLLNQAVTALFPGFELSLSPWPLRELGLWGYEDLTGDGLLWFVRGKRQTAILRYMAGAQKPPKRLLAYWYELKGVLDLVDKLQKGTLGTGTRPAGRMLVLTCSVGLRYERPSGKVADAVEFDGGVVTIDGRSGRMVFYGLETRSSHTAEKCKHALERKWRDLAERMDAAYRTLLGPVGSVNSHSAYGQVSLDSREITRGVKIVR